MAATDEQRARCEAAFSAARRIARARREEQDRIAAHIEQLIYEAKETETIDTLVILARLIFEPRTTP